MTVHGYPAAAWSGFQHRTTMAPCHQSVLHCTMGRHAPELGDMKTWTDCLEHSKLRSFTDSDGHFWLEQNASKPSKWSKLAKQGHSVAWEFEGTGGAYTGRMLVDGEIYTVSEATKKFLASSAKYPAPEQNNADLL